jgi:hypothetical protein
MITVLASLVICIAGLIIYCFSNNAKVMAVSLHCFWVGLLVFLLLWHGIVAIKP